MLAAGADSIPEPRQPMAVVNDPGGQHRCQSLMQQFDTVWPSRQAYPNAQNAYQLREQGQAACQRGQYRNGIHDMKRALLQLHIKPVKPPKGP